MNKGRISAIYTVWCGCGNWAPSSQDITRKGSASGARHDGWKHGRRYGWQCPECHRAALAAIKERP